MRDKGLFSTAGAICLYEVATASEIRAMRLTGWPHSPNAELSGRCVQRTPEDTISLVLRGEIGLTTCEWEAVSKGLQLHLGSLVFDISLARPEKNAGDFGPAVRG